MREPARSSSTSSCFCFWASASGAGSPAIVALRAEEASIRKSQEELKQRIAELTAERNKLKTIIECELGYTAREAAAQQEIGKKS